jgi:hypothetical protein
MCKLKQYLLPLLARLAQKQVRDNLKKLIEKMVAKGGSNLYSLYENKSEYVNVCRMLSGDLKTVVDTDKLNISLLQNAIPFFKGKKVVSIVHDCSPIRKPESRVLDGLGKVQSLDNTVVNGYNTFATIAVDVGGREVRLLACTPFSNGVDSYVSKEERKAYETGQIKDPQRRAAIAAYDASGESHHQKDIVFAQVRLVSAHIKSIDPDISVVDIFDRGFDDVELFELETALGHDFIIRCKASRNSNEMYIDEKGIERCLKLKNQRFWKGDEVMYDRISFKKRTYKNVKGVFEWNTVEINGNIYSVLRVTFYQSNGKKIFSDDMLLLTSLTITGLEMAKLIWEMYMQRMAIESVFKFCKDELQWEAPRVNDWLTMKHLLSLVYFVAGYFYEIKDDLVQDEGIQWLAKIANGKGKVSPHFILKGIAMLIAYIEIKKLIDEGAITEEHILYAESIFMSG